MKVLGFHTVSDIKNFENLILYIKSKYNVVDAEEFEKIFFKGKKVSNPLLITFDDGDRSIYENAFPILIKHQIPAIIFVVTELIDTSKPFWWDEIEYYLDSPSGRKKVWEVKTWSNSDREKYLKTLRLNSKKAPLVYPQLSITDLNEMQSAGITIANHSHTHPMLDQCTSQEIEKEILCSMKFLDKKGFHGNIFAYPNGNYSLTAENILRNKGIKLAFRFDHRINDRNINPLQISRLIVNDTTPLWKLKFILSGWHTRILPLTKRIGKLRKE